MPTDPEQTPEGAAHRRLTTGDEDLLVREEPLLITVGGQQLITMRTPGDDLHLALGFLLSEGVIEAADDVLDHRLTPGLVEALRADEIELRVRDASVDKAKSRLTRTHEIGSSCGICGLTDPDELLEDMRPLLPGVPRLGPLVLAQLCEDFAGRSVLFAQTGGSHSAVLYAADGTVLGLGEDVGRHNALDKAIGSASLAGHDLRQAIAVLSGRAGYDLTVKCLRVGIPIIASVSAASALSHDLCLSAGATLVGFLRGSRAKVYCDGGRLTQKDAG